MALFLNSINRELLGNIISQQVSIYKQSLEKTHTNIYGESPDETFYDGPYMFSCLIDRQDQVYTYETPGVHFNQLIKVAFFKPDLEAAKVTLDIGDIILYQEAYYGITSTIENQYFIGHNPDYPDARNPYNNHLENYGKSVSLTCTAYYIPADKVNISPYRER